MENTIAATIPSPLRIKAVLKDDVRKISLQKAPSLVELTQTLLLRFDLDGSTVLKLKYEDADGDLVTVCDDNELKEVIIAAEPGMLKLFLSAEARQPQLEEGFPLSLLREFASAAKRSRKDRTVHWGVSCDGCGMNPIVGPRFHKRGENYDLCEAEFCKLSAEEQDGFVRVEAPSHYFPWHHMQGSATPSSSPHPPFEAGPGIMLPIDNPTPPAQDDSSPSAAPTAASTEGVEVTERAQALVVLGFSPQEAYHALDATKGSVERAADLLLSGTDVLAAAVGKDDTMAAVQDGQNTMSVTMAPEHGFGLEQSGEDAEVLVDDFSTMCVEDAVNEVHATV